jgi:YjbE family integral membrane protein
MSFLPQFATFVQIVLIDLSLAGDNAIVVGMAAAGLPKSERHRAIAIGIGAATVLRIVFALIAVQMMKVFGLTLAGGLLLLWVAWKLYFELKNGRQPIEKTNQKPSPPGKTLKQAVIQIAVADISMSLDNVLGVAGAARDHLWVLVLGLALSVILMGAASTLVVKLLHRWRWIGYAGLLVVVYVALRMMWDGGIEISHAFA